MSETLVSQGIDAVGAGSVPSAFVRTWRDGGRDAAWVHAAGEIDDTAVARLEQALHRAELRARLVVLDLRELTSIDAPGIEMIARASVRARRTGGRLVLVRGPAEVDRMFVGTGASDSVEIVDLDSVERLLHPLPKSSPGRFV